MASPGMVARPHRMQAPAATRLRVDADNLFVFLLMGATLFTLQLSGVVLIYLMLVGGYVAMRPGVALPAMARCAPILLLPGFVLLSATWSLARDTTLYQGSEYLLTVIAGILVGAAARHGKIDAILAAYLLWSAASLLYGALGGELGGTRTFIGLAGSKNASGDAAAVGMIVGVAVLLPALSGRRPLRLAAAAALVIIDAIIVASAESAGAVIAVAIGSLAVIAWSASRLLPIAVRSTILIATIVVAAIAAATMHLWSEALFNDLLHASGKSTTLTGRTYIWSRANVLISQRPMFGLGYSAFWHPGNLEAEAIWRRLGIFNRSGFHFHNTIRDIVVQLGYVGLLLSAIVFGVYLTRLFWQTLRAPDAAGIFFCGVVLACGLRAEFEIFGFSVFSHTTLLLIAGMAYATVGAPAPARARRATAPRLIGLREPSATPW